jgi:Fe-Mn family superoxide dismutase
MPVLALDMYEHAYHMDFGAAAARYIDAFMANVKWEEVGRRDEWARKAARP